MRRLGCWWSVGIALLWSGCWTWAPPQRDNLVPNPGCDEGTAGWFPYQSTLNRAESLPFSGPAACLVEYESGIEYSLLAVLDQVEFPVGSSYRAAAWMRSDTAAGALGGISVRQTAPSVPNEETKNTASLTGDWQLLTVTGEVTLDGELELYVFQLEPSPGDSFMVDEILLLVEE